MGPLRLQRDCGYGEPENRHHGHQSPEELQRAVKSSDSLLKTIILPQPQGNAQSLYEDNSTCGTNVLSAQRQQETVSTIHSS